MHTQDQHSAIAEQPAVKKPVEAPVREKVDITITELSGIRVGGDLGMYQS